MTDPRNWKLDWQKLSLEDREREYSPSSCIGGNYQPYIRAYADLSTAARRAHVPATVRYGTTERQTLDLWPSPGKDFGIMQRVKNLFDPSNLLNRRRLYGRI